MADKFEEFLNSLRPLLGTTAAGWRPESSGRAAELLDAGEAVN